MITKRIIPCLDVKNGRVVKGVNFEGLSDVSSPVELAAYYSRAGADELVFYDITASAEGRELFTDILCEVASKIFIPLTVGGGINTIEDFDRVLKCGADKVSVNSGAIKRPALIEEAAKKSGDQCVVLSVDAKRVDGQFRVFGRGGRDDTGMDAIEWIKRGVGMGAGVGIGAMMANAMAGSNNQNDGNANNAAGGTVCPSCGKTVPAGSKFCPECGKAVSATKFCPECGAKVSAGAKFCPECGKKLG